MSGSIESIAASLSTIAKHLPEVTKALSTVGTNSTSPAPVDNETDDEIPIPEATGKKTAKKRASKKTAAKKTKADDHSDIQLYKRKLVDVADASGVDNVMKELKAFLESSGYAASDEIEVEDRAAFLTKVKDHFEELAGDGDESEGDEDGLDDL